MVVVCHRAPSWAPWLVRVARQLRVEPIGEALELLLLRSAFLLAYLLACVLGSALDTGVDLMSLGPINDYWEDCRAVYRPFESGQLTGSADVYDHEVREAARDTCLACVCFKLPQEWRRSLRLTFPAANLCCSDAWRPVHEPFVPVQAAGTYWAVAINQARLRRRQSPPG